MTQQHRFVSQFFWISTPREVNYFLIFKGPLGPETNPCHSQSVLAFQEIYVSENTQLD